MATLLIDDSFELADLSIYSVVVNNPRFVSVPDFPVWEGRYAMEIWPPAEDRENIRINISAGNRVTAVRFMVRSPTWGNNNARIFELTTGTGSVHFRYNLAAQRFQLFAVTGSLTADIGPVVLANTWYLVDLELNSTADPHVFRGKIDGGVEGSVSPVQAASDIQNVILGTSQFVSWLAPVHYDILGVSVTPGDYPIGGTAGNPAPSPGIAHVVPKRRARTRI